MRRRLAATAVATLILAGCSGQAPAGDPTGEATGGGTAGEVGAPADLLAEHGLTGMDAAQVVEHLDRLPLADRPADLMASVRQDQLLLSDDTREVALDMPADRTYVSVAPYVDTTHECYYHSLTTCRGELGGTPVEVTVVDDATGEVLVDDVVTTYDNGFVGLWLPRDLDATIEVAADGRTGSADVVTTDDGATCVTTLQLT